MSLLEFARDNEAAAATAALLSVELMSRPALLGRVLGAGLVDSGYVPSLYGGGVVPMVVLNAASAPFQPGLYSASGDLLETLLSVLDPVIDVLARTPAALYVIPSPEPQATSGDPISSPSIGSVGCQANWNGGSGFLTAGHVAPLRGAGVYDGRTLLGTVAFANNPAGTGTASQADVAVVELTSGQSYTPAFGRAVAAYPNQSVTVYSASRPGATIMGFCSFMYWPRSACTYGDTYITTGAVSTGGDSGSAVINGSHEVIGMVVGGTAGMTTMIQDARYQISSITGLPGLAI